MRNPLVMAALIAASAASSCHSPGPYGHGVHYTPLGDEAAATADAREYDPVLYTRAPEDWRKGRVALFGIVESRTSGTGGAAMLKLSVRRLEPRNACQNERDEETCRTTVSDKDFGVVYALVQLTGEDDTGPLAVGSRSLLRVSGKLGEEVSSTEGAPILRATFYRHFPAFAYVTTNTAFKKP